MYVLMITPNQFPDGDAGAVRDYYFAKIYQALGYAVVHVGMSKANHFGKYDGIEYISLYKEKKSVIQKFIFRLGYKQMLMSYLSELFQKKGTPKVIHIYDIPAGGIQLAKKYAQSLDIPIIHDSVEWYSPCEFMHGRLSYPYILKERTNRFLIKNPIRVIAISSFLYDYFVGKGIKSTRIPVIMDTLNPTNSSNSNETINFIYAGSPVQNKDYLKEMVLAFEHLNEEQCKKVQFKILGATKEQIQNLVGADVLSSAIIPMGRVSRQVVLENLLKSDFSVLLRPSKERYAQAGFPTKVVEAMSHNVAMLCNISSDLNLYLKDMENAVIVDGYSAEDMYHSILRILALNREEIERIKQNAKKTAEQQFDYRLWIDEVKHLIEG